MLISVSWVVKDFLCFGGGIIRDRWDTVGLGAGVKIRILVDCLPNGSCAVRISEQEQPRWEKIPKPKLA